MSPVQKDRHPYFVTLAILLADAILWFLVHWASDFRLDKDLPSSICPGFDSIVETIPATPLFLFHALTAGIALFFYKWTRLRNILNTLLFIQTTLAMAFVTAHTGGLWRSIYGPGYLALFPVATIVPRSTAVKFWAALPVAVLAFLMAWHAPSRSQELFIWGTSIVGCSVGWGIQQFLLKVTSKDE
jgi:hypothetical protein